MSDSGSGPQPRRRNAFEVLMASGGWPRGDLVGIRACCLTTEDRDTFICGVELLHWHEWGGSSSVKWGRVAGAKKSEQISLGSHEHEHIIGVEFDDSSGDGVESIDFFTSDPGGRSITFYVSSGQIDTVDDVGNYVGVYGHGEGKDLGRKPDGGCMHRGEMEFECKRGNRVTGMTFENCTIVRIDQEPIPLGKNERWYEKSLEYTPPRENQSDSEEAEANTNLPCCDNESYHESTASVEEEPYTSLCKQSFGEIRRQYRDHEPIDFLRPDGSIESKDIGWCLGNRFFQIEEGLWSGMWFYDKHPRAEAIHGERIKRTEYIRSLCENQSWSHSDSESCGYGSDLSYHKPGRFEYCDMEGGICTCSKRGETPVRQLKANLSSEYTEHIRKRQIDADSNAKAKKKKKKKRKKLSQPKLDMKREKLIERVIRWSRGDEGVVRRTREATERINWLSYGFHCPVPNCRTRLPTQEVLDLHVGAVGSKTHRRYRTKHRIKEIATSTHFGGASLKPSYNP